MPIVAENAEGDHWGSLKNGGEDSLQLTADS
jgi:hypothetical protein